MRSVLIALISFVLCTDTANAQSGIRFDSDSFSVLLAKAQKEGKAVFIDCYTTWCAPCKLMEKNVFPNDTVGDFYNSRFVCASFDMEKGEGIDLKKRYDVRCYPTYLYLDANGTLLHRASGSCSVREFVRHGETAFSANSFAVLDSIYRTGSASSHECLRYLRLRQGTCLPVDSVLSAYIATQSKSAYRSQENWNVLRLYVEDPDCPFFRALITNRPAYEATYTTDSVRMVILKVYGTACNACLFQKPPDTTRYVALRAEITSLALPYTEKLVLGNDMAFYTAIGNWNAYAHTAARYIETYADSNWAVLNDVSWVFYEHVRDTALLQKALGWSLRSMNINECYYNADTYAALLYKLGRKEEALAAANRAIVLAEMEKIDSAGTKELLEKIEKMK